ncbi:hypothetical protein B0H66DRAFT_336023 [Apodospora peruviana]|uniref:Uncharacterized protein n=1 Tax=Apodospora peruviana TaxID=516989 RepID=A0AAE0M233_9PEZI|nr:hypothetical protein B0H66DRAFT_336023 [Apodospora peruviana]
MKTRGADSAAGPSSSSATAASSLVAHSGPSATTGSRRELRPRRAAGIRGAPPGATTPHAAPRIGGRLTRGLAAQLKANAGSSPIDNDDYPSSPEQPALSSSSQPRPLVGTSTSRSSRSSHKPSSSVPQSLAPAPLITGNRRLRKRGRPQSGFYGEDSDDEEDLENAYLSPSPDADPAAPPPSSSTQRTTRRRAPTSKSKRPKLCADSPRRSPGHRSQKPKVKRDFRPSEEASIENTVIPDWPSLPYFIWVQVFGYASASFNDDRDGVNWLLSTSRVCRAFAEPALTALYQCPALLTPAMAHNLVALLSRDPSTSSFNYRAKIEKLRIDVEAIVARSYKGKRLDCGALVAHLPRLKVIDFHHSKDLPPYRGLDGSLKWEYPVALFETLNSTAEQGGGERQPTKLTGWRWNSRLMGRGMGLGAIRTLHLTPCFASLKKLCFVNFQVPSLNAPRTADDAEVAAKDQAFIQSVADAIAALPDLEYLSIHCSTVVNEHFLPLLPKTLKTLELVNCWDINGDDFASYLDSHGHKLEQLNLHHNQSLNLFFLTNLRTACPKLRVLSMDFKTYKHHEFYPDSDPTYEEILRVDELPDWPETLETLELLNMRKWEADAAEVLFQSLVDSAPRLPKLRSLEIKAMLDIPFRQRSELRDKWEPKFKGIFLRKLADPLPFRTSRAAGEAATRPSPKARKAQRGLPVESPSRRSGRIATQMSNPSSRASSVGRELRRKNLALGRPSYAEPDTDDDDLDPEEDEEDEENSAGGSLRGRREENGSSASTPAAEGADLFIHGMCDKVEIQLDNQKPTEQIYRMEDFLDDEVSDDPSDEDWNGDQDVDVGYAW